MRVRQQTQDYLLHVKRIYFYINNAILRENAVLVGATAILGALDRIFSLLGLAFTFRAIVTALSPESTLNALNGFLELYGLRIDAGEMLMLLAGGVFLVYTSSWLCQILRDRFAERLMWKVLKRRELFHDPRPLDDDLFLIEDLSPHVQTVTRILEIVAFSALFVLIIAVFAPLLLLVLLPLLMAFVLFLVQHERKRLRYRQYKQDTRNAYVNAAGDKGHVKRRDRAEDIAERDEYIRARQAFQDIASGSARHGTLISGLVMVLITLYVASLEIDVGEFPFMPIFLVVSIRTLVSYSQQFAKSLTQILELRGKIGKVSNEHARSQGHARGTT